jgi:hypothetical protein
MTAAINANQHLLLVRPELVTHASALAPRAAHYTQERETV